MTTLLRFFLVLTLLFVAAAPAHAQEVTRLPDTAQQSVGVDAGLEAGFIARATYAHKVNLGFVPDARLVARFTLPVVTPDLGDWGIDAGVQASVLKWRDFRLALLIGPLVRNTVNEVFTATATGVSATMLVGYEGPRWGLSGEAGYEQILATHLSQSDRYRDTGYPGAKDGWYAITGSTAHAGLRGGVRFGAVEIAARAGLDGTGQLHALLVPFYATLGSAYAF